MFDKSSVMTLNLHPIIAYSGAGKVEHLSEVFEKTSVGAALAAGIFHKEEVSRRSRNI